MNNSKPSASRKYKTVCVKWGDASVDPDSFTEKEAKNTKPIVTTTIGFLICRNPHGIVLATDVYEDNPDLACKTFIPKGMIIKVTKLE